MLCEKPRKVFVQVPLSHTSVAYARVRRVLHVCSYAPEEYADYILLLGLLQRDMLRLDALIMTVQLNIRRLLEARLHALSF